MQTIETTLLRFLKMITSIRTLALIRLLDKLDHSKGT